MNKSSYFLIQEIECKNALNRLRSDWLPFKWDLNPYRGCGHGCKYCFAVYTHNYIESEDSNTFFQGIRVKINAAEQLERQLSSARWKKELINLGGVTDSYQPAERTYSIMPDILKVLIKYKNPVSISTKSDLILRDFDLFDELSHLTSVNIAVTITTADEEKRKILEPGASSTERRFRVLQEFGRTNVSTGLHFMPIIPYITDETDEIDELLRRAKETGICYVVNSLLNLRSSTRKVFFNFIRQQYPHLYDKFLILYKNGAYACKDYRIKLRGTVTKLRAKHSLIDDHRSKADADMFPRQMTIEDFMGADSANSE